jgi:PIN domain nuclease of toxin-antitoxin system
VQLWVQQALAFPKTKLMPITADIAVLAGQLSLQGFHGDPADRFIAATAMNQAAVLVTKDKTIRSFPQVQTIW